VQDYGSTTNYAPSNTTRIQGKVVSRKARVNEKNHIEGLLDTHELQLAQAQYLVEYCRWQNIGITND